VVIDGVLEMEGDKCVEGSMTVFSGELFYLKSNYKWFGTFEGG